MEKNKGGWKSCSSTMEPQDEQYNRIVEEIEVACVLVRQKYSLHSRLKTKPANFAYVLSKTIDVKT